MLDYCKTCPDKYTETCALPSTTNRLGKHAAVAGALLLEGLARGFAGVSGKVLETDFTGLICATNLALDAMYAPTEACVWLHKLNETAQ